MVDLNNEQTHAAVESLATEISNFCRNQPADVVMGALAALTAFGIVRLRKDDLPIEEALARHTAFIRHWIERHEKEGL